MITQSEPSLHVYSSPKEPWTPIVMNVRAVMYTSTIIILSTTGYQRLHVRLTAFKLKPTLVTLSEAHSYRAPTQLPPPWLVDLWIMKVFFPLLEEP